MCIQNGLVCKHTAPAPSGVSFIVEKATSPQESVTDADYTTLLEMEDELENKINSVFDEWQSKFWEEFNNTFVPLYLATKNVRDYIGIFLQDNAAAVDMLHKADGGVGDSITVLTEFISADELVTPIAAGATAAAIVGGQSALTVMRIDLQFDIVNETALEALHNYTREISTKVAANINALLREQLLAGIEAGEGVPEVTARLLQVWDKPIPVKVPPLYDANGNLVRNGYEYTIGSKQWATMVARTELQRAFVAGRIMAYRDSGVVEYVEYETAADERTCAVCEPLDGSVHKLADSDSLLPQHPNCRCTIIPIVNPDKLPNAIENLTALYGAA